MVEVDVDVVKRLFLPLSDGLSDIVLNDVFKS